MSELWESPPVVPDCDSHVQFNYTDRRCTSLELNVTLSGQRLFRAPDWYPDEGDATHCPQRDDLGS